MDDLDKSIAARKKRNPDLSKDFDEGYEKFKIGVLFRMSREQAGLTQEEIARRLNTKKSAISRFENHAEDIRLSTLRNTRRPWGRSSN